MLVSTSPRLADGCAKAVVLANKMPAAAIAKAFIGVHLRMVDLLGSLLRREKEAIVAAAAPDTVDQGFPSEQIALWAQKFRNQRKTHCNRNDWPNSSKPSLDRSVDSSKGRAYLAYCFLRPQR